MRDVSGTGSFLPLAAPRGISNVPQEDQSSSNSESNDLLRALVGLVGRAVFPEEKLRDLVSPSGNAAYFDAYLMCDGRTPLTAIVKQTGIDQGNLSKAVGKWVDAGIVFRIGPKRHPQNVYPVTKPADKAPPKRGRVDTTPKARPMQVDLLSSADAPEGGK